MKIDLEILDRLKKWQAVSGKLMYVFCHVKACVKAFACAGRGIICVLLVEFILSCLVQPMPNVFWSVEAEFAPTLRHQAH